MKRIQTCTLQRPTMPLRWRLFCPSTSSSNPQFLLADLWLLNLGLGVRHLRVQPLPQATPTPSAAKWYYVENLHYYTVGTARIRFESVVVVFIFSLQSTHIRSTSVEPTWGRSPASLGKTVTSRPSPRCSGARRIMCFST